MNENAYSFQIHIMFFFAFIVIHNYNWMQFPVLEIEY